MIHLGHNRSVDEVVTAALQEDAQGIALSSYQGGHVEYFKYMVDLLRQRGGAHIQVFGGGGGVIVPSRDRRTARPTAWPHLAAEDGQRDGPGGHDRRDADEQRLSTCRRTPPDRPRRLRGHSESARRSLAQLITALDNGKATRGTEEDACTTLPSP